MKTLISEVNQLEFWAFIDFIGEISEVKQILAENDRTDHGQ